MLKTNVSQIKCCCFSPDGTIILSGSGDKTLKLWITRDDCGTPTLVEQDVFSLLEHPSDVPLSEHTTKVLRQLFEANINGISFRSTGLRLVVSQLDTFWSNSTEQRDVLIQKHDELRRAVDETNHEVTDHAKQVDMIRQQLAEAEKQLASSQQKLDTLRGEERKCFDQQQEVTEKAEELKKCCDFYKGELDKTTSVMNQLSSKLKEHGSVSCLSQEEVLLLLEELNIPKSIRESFKKNQIGGKALELVSERIIKELGMSDINHRKALIHAICNVRVRGCIHVSPPPGACGDGLAAWWSSDEVWKWLESQGFNFPCLKGLTGRTLIHLSDEDTSQFGLPIGPALELKAKCEALKQSFFSFSPPGAQQSAHVAVFLCLNSFQLFRHQNLQRQNVFHQTIHQNSFVRFHKKS